MSNNISSSDELKSELVEKLKLLIANLESQADLDSEEKIDLINFVRDNLDLQLENEALSELSEIQDQLTNFANDLTTSHPQLQFNFADTSQILPDELNSELEKLSSYNQSIQEIVENKNYDTDEASIVLPVDTSILEKVMEMNEHFDTPELRYIFIVGIGGQSLGAKAIYKSLSGSLNDLNPESDTFPKLIFLETLSETSIYQIEDLIEIDGGINSSEELLIILSSKSGGTTETIVNAEILIDLFSSYFDDIESRIVTITDENSKLCKASIEKNIPVLTFPKKVGGRFSVFSAVGLFVISFVADIYHLVEGAKDLLVNEISKPINENMPAISAALIYLHSKNNIKINNNFFFQQDLEDIGKWYRQLMGESIGKKYDIDGNEVFAGVTPIVSMGTQDLHSVLQLYFGGPKDKFTSFVNIENSESELEMPESLFLGELVEGITGKDINSIADSIYLGVRQAYVNNNLPFAEIILPEICEYSIGQYLQFKMLEIIYLAKLMNVNAFDQPNVEDYKSVTREILSKKN